MVHTVTGAAASRNTLAQRGIAGGLVYVLLGVSNVGNGARGGRQCSQPSRFLPWDVFASDSRHSRCAAQRTGQPQTRFGEASRVASSCYGGGRMEPPIEREGRSVRVGVEDGWWQW